VIRVNLLPQKREAKRGGGEGGQGWLGIVFGVVLLQLVLLIVFHRRKQDELEVITQKNAQIQTNITQIQ
jgi:hypothetical protein